MMARISYVDPGTVTDPELVGYLADAREHGTPRLESQAIRAHVPAVLRTFSQSWQQVFRDGVLDHRLTAWRGQSPCRARSARPCPRHERRLVESAGWACSVATVSR
jgi:hypothetical protein